MDTIYINGTIITMDGSDMIAEAVAISGGRIQAIGSEKDILYLRTAGTQIIDLDGKTMLPGFIDAHSHFPMSGANSLYRVDLASPPIGTTSNMAAVILRLQEKAKQTPVGEWIVGVGYDDTLLAENRHPNRLDLDKVSTDHPVAAIHCSMHRFVVNSAALKRLGINREAGVPQSGYIERDALTNEPTGLFVETGFQYIAEALALTHSQQLSAIQQAAVEYAARGITTTQVGYLSDIDFLGNLKTAIKQKELPLRVIVWACPHILDEIQQQNILKGVDPDRLSLTSGKLFFDGSIQIYTAYLSKPYYVIPHDLPTDYSGWPAIKRDDLFGQIEKLHCEGWQVAVHCNGDAAIDAALDAFAGAQQKYSRQNTRHVIVHAQTVREDQLDRMKQLGIIPSFFSLHTYYWGDRHAAIFVGPERAFRMNPAHSAVIRDMRFTIHSDTPVVPINPLFLAWSAVQRQTASGQIIGEKQRITPLDALKALTIHAAWQSFTETTRGSIEPGKFADLVILSDNPLSGRVELKDIRVLETIVEGQSIYTE
ncbi:amidohydrolase [Sporomusa sp. KB1]|jgi:predicted amidohydrolase YtcJ|uniref:amidohydrolase n=1 Tax=Sporomusa sp. KB1 TaxID=943346 RepID=UPI00119D1A13|nr:amidohydrolase [Sporomusa sp. KB1]TWH51881.1 hypothetical protein Salpa_0359 [Sporomusa sp. KB1]